MSGEVAGYLVNAKCLYQLDGGLIEELENDKYPTLSGALNHSIPLKPESVLPLRYAGSPCCFLSQPHRDCMLVVKLHAGAVKPQVQAWFSNFKAPTTSPWVFRGKGCSKQLCWSSLDVFFFFFFFFCETIEPRQKKKKTCQSYWAASRSSNANSNGNIFFANFLLPDTPAASSVDTFIYLFMFWLQHQDQSRLICCDKCVKWMEGSVEDWEWLEIIKRRSKGKAPHGCYCQLWEPRWKWWSQIPALFDRAFVW